MRITQCRLCGSEKIEKIVDLGYHPLADTFLAPEVLYSSPELTYPLQLGQCHECGHVFTLFSILPEDRYQKTEYSYDSSNSKVSIQHFKEFAEAVLAEREPDIDGLVVDIGSNVGTLLGHFQGFGYQNVIGVEPSANISELAIKSGVPTINDFFCERVVKQLRDSGPVQVLLSANVLNHADDFSALLETAKQTLDRDGIFVFEVPYLLDLLKSTAFDTIYHEHVHYHSIQPLSLALARQGFSIFKIERTDYMCGSIRVYTRVGGSHHSIVGLMIKDEKEFGLFKATSWIDFMNRVRNVKKTVCAHLAEICANGGKVIGIGAATKGNTFLNYCRLDGDTIAYIADASALKVGKLTPGSHILIVGDASIDSGATHALILPWNIAPMLQEKLAHLELTFLVPLVEKITR